MRDFKIIITGQVKSGKSVLLQRILNNKYSDNYLPTIGGSYRANQFAPHQSLAFWDLTYFEKEKQAHYEFYKNKDCLLFCIDLSQPLNKELIVSTIKQFLKLNPNADIVLIGTKHDLKFPKISMEQIKQLKKDLSKLNTPIHSYMTSSKDNTNILDLKSFLTERAQHKFLENSHTSSLFNN